VTERRSSFPFPDVPQAIAFHQLLMQRLGIGDLDSPDENRLRSTLDRAHSTVQHQRGDVVTLASFLLFGLIRDKPFGKGSTQTGIALTLAFLLRNGVVVVAPEEEIAGVGVGIASGEVYAGMVEMWLRDSARPAW
jgi:prophage maintenance system killer protein